MTTSTVTETIQTAFETEILDGLRAMPKYLLSKYFYDKAGDRIFQEIMNCDEYYPSACELEIFRRWTAEMAAASGSCATRKFIWKSLRSIGLTR